MATTNGNGAKNLALAITLAITIGGLVWGLSTIVAGKADDVELRELQRDVQELRIEMLRCNCGP